MKLNKLQLDALKEIGTVGAGNAATSLSTLLGQRVNINVPDAQVVAIEEIPGKIGAADELVTVLLFEVDGTVDGVIMLLFTVAEAKKLAGLLLAKSFGQVDLLDEMTVSTLKEIGNVTTGAYLNALAGVTKLKLTHSIPNYASDMLGSILDAVLIKLALDASDAVVIENEHQLGTESIKGYILFIPDQKGLQTILKSLGV